ncbi:MAG: phage tail tape measure protein [Candidatus Cloacimonetes bacterium]|nr:phage tail tape measure protein [Candidatus Cloacimonadota bacterium]
MKEFAISFAIGAVLSGSFKNAFQNARAEISETSQISKSVGTAAMKLGGGLAAIEAGATMAFGSLSALAEPAIKFESAMADVKKVVDFDTPKQFQEMNEDILKLSTNRPMVPEEIAKIVAAGGQAGIAKDDLMGFAEAAAKMGVAFDVTADEAGDMMAKWRTAFRMNQTEVVALADKVNYLGNTTAASAPLISDVVTRIGPLGDVAGVASGEIAALGATMIATGTSPEIAATGIKNMMLAMTKGESATKKQAEAFAQLGLTAEDMAKRMQVDARGAIMSLLEAVQGFDKDKQAAILNDLFGSESIGAIAPMLTNLKALQTNMEAVGDVTKYAGSMDAEFQARSATTENEIQLLKNSFAVLSIEIGNALLPVIKTVAGALKGFGQIVSEFAKNNPKLTETIVYIASGAAVIVSAVTIIGGLTAVIAPVISGFMTFAGAAMKVFNAIRSVWGIFMMLKPIVAAAFAATPVGWITAAVVGLIAVVYLLYNHWEEVKTVVCEVSVAIYGFFTQMISIAGTILAEFGNMFMSAITFVMGLITSLGSNFSSVFSAALIWVSNVAGAIANSIGNAIDNAIAKVKSLGSAVANGLGFGAATPSVAANASGGIYNRGAFLTTFAENEGESAIPHSPTKRNIGLLAKTNEIMGSPLGGSGTINASFAPNITIAGNADKAVIQQAVSEEIEKFKVMLQSLQHEQRRVCLG